MSNPEVTHLLRNVVHGKDGQAAAQLWEHYHPRLLKIARHGLERLPDNAIQDEDIVQSSMNSFFRAAELGKAERIRNRHELWAFLLTITQRKLNRKYERANATKRRSCGQVSIQAAHLEIADTDGDEMFSCCDELIKSLNDPKLRIVAVLRLEGYTVAEIAEKLQVARATIKRRLSRIRELWTSEDEDGLLRSSP